MRFICCLLSLFILNCLKLKASKGKNFLEKEKGNKQSYLTNEDMLNLKRIIRENQSKKSNEIRLPKLALPSLFDKQDHTPTARDSNKLVLPNKISSGLHANLKCCGIEVKHVKPKPQGHYEKVVRKVENYFWVKGEKPSGMPGAFLVSSKEAKSHLGLESR